MNKFNQLYNLILESIISQNKQYRKNIIAKSDLPQQRKEQLLDYLSMLDNKTADFLVRYFADGTLTSPLDERVRDIKAILRLNSSIDTQGWKGTLEQFIQQYGDVIKDQKEKEFYNDINYIDKLPQLSQRKDYGHNVRVYKVEDSKEGMLAIRKIVDNQLGTDTNPWCLINLKNNGQKYWEKYNGYPKHVAFQGNKILAFSANDTGENLWWDLKDKSSIDLFTFNKKRIETEHYKWNDEECRQIFIKNKNLTFNQQTKRYDCKGELKIMGWDCIDDKFPVPIGIVEGNFSCYWNPQITTLQNGPTEVKGNYNCAGCQKLVSLKGGPKKVGGSFSCYQNKKLLSFEGGPEYVGEKFWCSGCKQIKNFKGAPKYVGKDFTAGQCISLQSLQGCPETIGDDLDIRYCEELKSLQNGPKKLGGIIICPGCSSLKITEEDKKKYLITGDF